MKKPKVADVAAFMLKRLKEDQILYQEGIVSEILQRFGDAFVYANRNGNPAIDKKVLDEFRKLTAGAVVWSRGDRYWRFREDYDDPGTRSTY